MAKSTEICQLNCVLISVRSLEALH